MKLFSTQPTEQDIIDGIRHGGPARRRFENQLYDRFDYLIRDGTRKHRLSEEECASAYSDAVLSVIEHIATGRFEGRSGLKTYLYQIFTNKCVDLIRKNTTNRSSVNRTASLDESLFQLSDSVQSVVQQLIARQDIALLQQRLRLLSDKCRDMVLAWGEGYSDAEIATMVGYQSADVAKTSRLRCLERLRELYRMTKP